MNNLVKNRIENIHIIRISVFVPIVKIVMGGFIAMAICALFIWGINDMAIQSVTSFLSGGTIISIIMFFYIVLIVSIVLGWGSHYYAIDNQTVFIYNGVIFTRTINYDMAGIESVEVDQGLLGKIFNFGTLKLFNPHLKRELTFNHIPNPNEEAAFIHHIHPNPVAFVVNRTQ